MALISEARQRVTEAGLDRLSALPEFAARDTWTAPLTNGGSPADVVKPGAVQVGPPWAPSRSGG